MTSYSNYTIELWHKCVDLRPYIMAYSLYLTVRDTIVADDAPNIIAPQLLARLEELEDKCTQP